MKNRIRFISTLLGVFVLGAGMAFGQVTYNGNGNSGFGSPVGGSSLEFNDDGTTITGTFTKGAGDFNDILVIYIANGASGRSAINSDVNDQEDNGRRAISQAGDNASIVTFPAGFEATHAIAIGAGFGGIWSIPSSGAVGNNGLPYVDGVGNPASNTSASFTFSFNWSEIGLTSSDDFHFVISYLNGGNGFLADEGYGKGLPTGNPGSGDVTYTSYFEYTSGDEIYPASITGSAGFRLMTSPVTTSYSDVLAEIWTQGASSTSDTDEGDPNVLTWDRTTDAWQGVTNLDANVVAGTGFLVYVYADDNYDGSDDAFPKTLSVSGTENAVDAAPTLNSANDGYTLVGNPFATTIDFDDATKVDLTNVAHVWDPSSSSWKTWNGTTGDITDGLITPFQGFFVQNSSSPTSPSITFVSGSKSSGGTFLGKAVNINSFVRLNVEGNGLSNSAWLQLSEEGSFSNKVMGDAIELQPLSTSYAQLAIQKGSELMDIAHVNANEEYSLPLAFSSTTGGEFTLEATDFSIPSNVVVTFHDYQEGVSMKLDESFSYSFETAKLKAQDVPPLSVIKTMEVLKAKSVDGERFGLTISPSTTVSNDEEIASVESFKLEQNYPNPFNPSTTIKYAVGENGPVNITVYNVMGQKVAQLLNTTKTAGNYQVTWNAAGVSSGIYYYRLTAPGQVLTRQMTLIK